MTTDDQKSEARREPMKEYSGQKRKAREVVGETLRAALNEGAARQAVAQWWGTLRAEAIKRAKARKRAGES